MPVKSSIMVVNGIGLSSTLSAMLANKSSNNISVKNKNVKMIFIPLFLKKRLPPASNAIVKVVNASKTMAGNPGSYTFATLNPVRFICF